MSGGHWDYDGFKVEDLMSRIATDEAVLKRWPRVAKLFGALGPVIYGAEHEMDWDLSSDQAIENDTAFEKDILDKVRKALDEAVQSH